ncbi:MAG: hypothetical protein J5379_04555 [Clostridiales bacterium]|nr:hypothetical protein [Clostridiales bacterium]
MSDNKEKKNTGHSFEITVGTLCALTIVFIILKICKVIGWSWLWVFSPLWLSFSLLFIYLFVVFILTSLKR